MNQEQVLSLIRTVLQIAGTYVVASGKISAENWATWTGGALIIIATAWSMWAHTTANQIKAVTQKDEVRSVSLTPEGKDALGLKS